MVSAQSLIKSAEARLKNLSYDLISQIEQEAGRKLFLEGQSFSFNYQEFEDLVADYAADRMREAGLFVRFTSRKSVQTKLPMTLMQIGLPPCERNVYDLEHPQALETASNAQD